MLDLSKEYSMANLIRIFNYPRKFNNYPQVDLPIYHHSLTSFAIKNREPLKQKFLLELKSIGIFLNKKKVGQ